MGRSAQSGSLQTRALGPFEARPPTARSNRILALARAAQQMFAAMRSNLIATEEVALLRGGT
jgi:hypothetical protein